MPFPEELDYWINEVSTAFCQLSTTQARVLALYSYGMALTSHCGQTIIVTFLSLLLKRPHHNLRQRLREWNYEPQQKRGKKRRAVEVESQFAALLGWVLGYWEDGQRLVLALDVTYLCDRHTILSISVVYRGTAIPVAWQVLLGNEKGEWHPLWVRLLECLQGAVSQQHRVYVLCDRGLYSKRLFEVITQCGWHPLMRIRPQGKYRRCKAKTWQALETVAYRGMPGKRLRVQCFKGDPLLCTLWVQWHPRYDEPCLIVSDLSPKQLVGSPYALRVWIEAGFKDLKRGGLHWEQTKTTAPLRLQRLLLVMAVALFWLIRQGSALKDELLHERLAPALSCTTLGWLSTLVCAIQQRPLPFAYFVPYSFSPSPSSLKTYP